MSFDVFLSFIRGGGVSEGGQGDGRLTLANARTRWWGLGAAQVRGAQWQPAYDCRGEAASEDQPATMTLTYQAHVTQRTGEDWQRVRLALSTSQPAAGGDVPSLAPEVLAFYDPQQERMHMQMAYAGAAGGRARGRPMAKSARMRTAAAAADGAESLMMMGEEEEEMMDAEMDLMAMDDMMPAAMPVMMHVATAAVEEGTLGATFNVAAAASIPADGEAHTVVIGVVAVQPVFSYVAVPRASQRAYLVAHAANQSPYPLLPGAMQVFLDGAATATVQLPLVSPGENVTVSFGTDDAVRVKELPVARTEEDKGLFFGETKKRTVRRLLSVTNNRRTPVTVEVRDQLPQSSHKELQVKLLDKTTAAGAAAGAVVAFSQPQPQSLQWQVTLPPGVEQQLEVRFSLEWPKDKKVVGGGF